LLLLLLLLLVVAVAYGLCVGVWVSRCVGGWVGFLLIFQRVVIPFAGLRIQESITNLIYNRARASCTGNMKFRERAALRVVCTWSWLCWSSKCRTGGGNVVVVVAVVVFMGAFGHIDFAQVLFLKHFIELLKAVKSNAASSFHPHKVKKKKVTRAKRNEMEKLLKSASLTMSGALLSFFISLLLPPASCLLFHPSSCHLPLLSPFALHLPQSAENQLKILFHFLTLLK